MCQLCLNYYLWPDYSPKNIQSKHSDLIHGPKYQIQIRLQLNEIWSEIPIQTESHGCFTSLYPSRAHAKKADGANKTRVTPARQVKNMHKIIKVGRKTKVEGKKERRWDREGQKPWKGKKSNKFLRTISESYQTGWMWPAVSISNTQTSQWPRHTFLI